ncbi:hypothetical protein VN1172_06150 [Helicobacter pylori]|uniref:hypothetical protein n=1 Tax=Helicobacter pylori TaxID=210 RepID=UPI00103782DC|nr:hypothetical protein [Helicobacter pylori]GHS58136.1 hypothetical protein VN1172_06150 [Helicobacter pylori]
MWHERFLKVFPAVMFLFSILSIFELFLIIEDMNKTEKLEREIKQDLEAIETITELLNEHLEGMDLEHFHDKKIRIK